MDLHLSSFEAQIFLLTHWCWDKMANIVQVIFSSMQIVDLFIQMSLNILLGGPMIHYLWQLLSLIQITLKYISMCPINDNPMHYVVPFNSTGNAKAWDHQYP